MKTAIFIAAIAVVAGTSGADARRQRETGEYGRGGVPELNVRQSCLDAQKFSTGDNKDVAFKGCMQDETSAKGDLKKRWSGFKAKDKQTCVEQARAPSPSYVEVLTCLEMYGDAMRNAPRVDGKVVPQIGGPAAPGLTAGPTPPPAQLPGAK